MYIESNFLLTSYKFCTVKHSFSLLFEQGNLAAAVRTGLKPYFISGVLLQEGTQQAPTCSWLKFVTCRAGASAPPQPPKEINHICAGLRASRKPEFIISLVLRPLRKRGVSRNFSSLLPQAACTDAARLAWL